MWNTNDRALKEWALACKMLQEGRQLLLIRKGGLREEEGRFVPRYPEFFLFPTFEHQRAELLQDRYKSELEPLTSSSNPGQVVISAYAVVTDVFQARSEEQVMAAAEEHIWNAEYVRQRFDFNPYDPLTLLVLRVYVLPQPIVLPFQKAYEGCRSWITLDRALSTEGAIPVLPTAEFERRRESLRTILARSF
ncbi:hypothetical protein CWRG_02798 [Chthonomonas calidirosea]|uniref:DUF1802 family protein n=1 Tax=Chthonomonas calidirosea TaxID=454171 RepID=UPI0006DD4157|nr:DUF1802 family protein [Chthonomonas calidirosea]CEK20330.1 hypothetical protein CWRG_02798 [Chthonomonas calidirosea]CEK20331.1 hypothetical protein CP488_02821 [Chthonomonas calidirosea]